MQLAVRIPIVVNDDSCGVHSHIAVDVSMHV